MKVLLFALAACLCAVSPSARAEPYTIFLLDVSGSMEFPVAKEKRLDRAKTALVDTMASGRYPEAELIMWNTEKLREDFGDGAELAQQVNTVLSGHRASNLGLGLLSISDAGYRCAHVVFVTDEYPDDVINFTRAVDSLLNDGGRNTVTVYVVSHPESYYYAKRFSEVAMDARYRVVDGNTEGSLEDYLKAHPAADACGTLS